jgi:anaerobic ribonucleoside-triphosphate reductase activating protein
MTEYKLKIANIIKGSMVNGEGLRYAIFLQGCEHKCDGCSNFHTWDSNKGNWVHMMDLLTEIVKNKNILDGVTFSGGEPLLQYDKVLFMCKLLKMFNINIAMWTGYSFEVVLNSYSEILKHIDFIVTDPFKKELKCDNEYYGSSNQRVFIKRNGKWSQKLD